MGRLLQQIVVGLCLIGFEKLFVNAVDQPVSSSNSAVFIESETGRSHGRIRTGLQRLDAVTSRADKPTFTTR